MSKIVVTLPLGAKAEAGALGRLVQRLEAEDPAGFVSLRPHHFSAIEIGIEGGASFRVPLPANGAAANSRDSVEVAESLHLKPSPADRIEPFLARHNAALDHIGLNLSHRDIDETTWRALVEAAAASLPLYRLEVGSPNDILLALQTDPETGAVNVLELVRDQSAGRTSLHFCLSVKAPRKAVEAAFPDPFGGYKPGDEQFFRSAAFMPELAMPAYLDFAFEDGGLTPWPQIVAAMGKRVGA